MKPATHPVWSLIRLSILMLTLTVVLWLNASHFDHTEIKTIIWTFLAAAGLEGGIWSVLRGLSKQHENP